ncbi:MAG: glycerol kinase GlpK [Anaerolineae bacterium]|nr:glycerol kinase GlpK [Anaerolineae bacterium]
MAQYAAAVDQGTTGTRFMIFDRQGQVVASMYEEHTQIYPQPGWVEHDAGEIWAKTRRVIAGAMSEGNIRPAEITGIGVTNQRETTVVWDPTTGEPLCNAVVWQDTRTRELCQRLIADGLEPTFREKTGLPIATYFSGPKLKWLLDHVPGLREKAEAGEAVFGNVDTWVIWNLTGGPQGNTPSPSKGDALSLSKGGAHVTDVTNASRTMLMNLRTLDWDDELLEILSIPRPMLPTIRPSSDPDLYGTTQADGPVGGPVPVCGDLGDQQAALFGQTCYNEGEAKNTYGTGCFMLLNTGLEPIPSKSGLLTTVAYGLPEGTTYALEGSIAITGAAVQWLRDNLGLIQSAAETEQVAQSVEDAGGIYFVPAFSGLFAPYWDMDARGVIVGLTRYVTRAHIVRATLEAICYQTRDVLEAMRADSGIELTALKVDGGATVNDFLMQLQADVLGVPVVRPVVHETTALGAAYAAGLATGLWSGLDELRANWCVDRVFEPQWDEARREEAYAGWKKAVERSRGWVGENDK